MSIAVRYPDESDRNKIYPIISQWCIEHKIIAIPDKQRYHTTWTTGPGALRDIHTTTFWIVPDEKERTMFILKWGNNKV